MKKSIPFAILGGVVGYGLACYHGIKIVGWVLEGMTKAMKEDRERPAKRSYSSYGSYSRNYRPSSYSNYKKSTDEETHSVEDIIIDNEDEVVQIITRLHNLQREYGQVSIADLYDLVGIISHFTDYHWGWKDLSTATYNRVCLTGYRLNLPAPIKL